MRPRRIERNGRSVYNARPSSKHSVPLPPGHGMLVLFEWNGVDLVSSQIRDAVLIVNPTAGGGRRVGQLDKARRIFRNAGIETELQNTTAAGEATVMARRGGQE